MKIKTKVNKLISTLLVAALMSVLFTSIPLTARAEDADNLTFHINHTLDHGGSGTLSAEMSGNTVTVTGTVTGAVNQLRLDIDSGVTVIWKAQYSGTRNGELIYLEQPGTFEVAAGGSIINNGTGNTVWLRASNATFKVSGGTVSATGVGNAIYSSGDNNKITVSSGAVSATTGLGIAVNGANSAITVSGGTISATTGAAVGVNNSGATVAISGGMVSVTTGIAVAVNGANINVTVNGGMVSAFNQAAIAVAGSGSTVKVNGGIVVAYGADITGEGNVINMLNGGSPTIGGTAVVCAWNKPGGTPAYTAGSSTDLTISPSAATVVWDKSGSQDGVSFANGANAGFFPISGVTVNAAEETSTPTGSPPAATPTPAVNTPAAETPAGTAAPDGVDTEEPGDTGEPDETGLPEEDDPTDDGGENANGINWPWVLLGVMGGIFIIGVIVSVILIKEARKPGTPQ